MRKVLSRIGALVTFAGFFWMLSAVGGLEQDISTWSQFWVSIAHSVPMMFVGVCMSNLYTW